MPNNTAKNSIPPLAKIFFIPKSTHLPLNKKPRCGAGIEYCAVKVHLLTYTIFFYFTAFQANDAAILRVIRLPLVAAGLAVPFWIIIHNHAAAKADFSGPSLFPHFFTG